MQFPPLPIDIPPITDAAPDDDSILALKFCGEHEFIGIQPLLEFTLYELVVEADMADELAPALFADSPNNFCEFDNMVIFEHRSFLKCKHT